LGDRPRSCPLFTKTLVLPHISHFRLSRQVWSCNCHRSNFQPYRLFSPHRSIYRGFTCFLPEPPILHRRNSRSPSSPDKLTIIDLFFSYERTSQSITETRLDIYANEMVSVIAQCQLLSLQIYKTKPSSTKQKLLFCFSPKPDTLLIHDFQSYHPHRRTPLLNQKLVVPQPRPALPL
jgi:hypothetical protein